MSEFFSLSRRLDLAPGTEIARRQTELLREHLRHALRHSPFYRERLSGLDPEKFTLEELRRLPTTTKRDLAEQNEAFLAVPPEEIADLCFTSGTTGKPCRVAYTARDLERLAYNDAVGFSACGLGPGDTALLTCTIDRCFIAGLAYYLGVRKLGATAIRNGLNTAESHAEVIAELRPDTIVGVPSFLAKLGLYLRERGVPPASIRRLICIGEPLRDRELKPTPLGAKLAELYPGRHYSTYAGSEIATSFTECTAGCGGHCPPELAIFELLDDDDRPVPPGTVGEVTVTPLQVQGMPLIRFRTGDLAFQLPETTCPCGRQTSRLGPILGRKAQMLKIRGTTLFPSAFTSVLEQLPEVAEYYLEVSGTALSDQLEIFVALRDPDYPLQRIAEQLYSRTRLHVPVRMIPLKEAERKVFQSSRKPVRFFDRRA